MLSQISSILLPRAGRRVLTVILFITLLTACSTERNYRGVPNPSWQELTGEQKQLIVDQAYEQDFKPITKNPGDSK